MERKNAWKSYGQEDLAAVEELSIQYRRFLDAGKTERECIAQAVRMAEEAGFINLLEAVHEGKRLQPGDQAYISFMEKSAAFFRIGTTPLEQGMNIIGAHVDSPRLDLKQVPCYEEAGNVYLDTHYYGGIKKYQWFALPLALHGIIVRKDKTRVCVSVGEKEEDPAFVFTDLLPHLGRERNEEKVKDFFNAEKMDLLIGNRPLKDQEAKEYVLELLAEQFGIREEDFLCAELEIVPAGGARECGFDRSMVLSYGQDDRSCAFAALTALLDTPEKANQEKESVRTACCLLVDKEETGSNGATGMKSRFFENAVAELLFLTGEHLKSQGPGELPFDLRLRRTLLHSRMLSADVSAAFDPMFETYFEKKNSAYLGNGLVFNKYSGSGGKSGANDANPEYMAQLCRIMDEELVTYQTAELGAVDQGGGGTIAYIMAKYGMEVIDCGLAVLSMHAPWEVTSKADLYEAVKGYRAFYKKML